MPEEEDEEKSKGSKRDFLDERTQRTKGLGDLGSVRRRSSRW